jgi:hypothetical protein
MWIQKNVEKVNQIFWHVHMYKLYSVITLSNINHLSLLSVLPRRMWGIGQFELAKKAF